MRRKEKSKILLSNLTNNPEFMSLYVTKKTSGFNIQHLKKKLKLSLGVLKRPRKNSIRMSYLIHKIIKTDCIFAFSNL